MTIEERLDRLEAQNRHLRLVLALAVVVGTVGLIMGQAGQDTIADVVRARAFHVVSEDGTPLVKVEYTFGVGVGLAGTITTINGKGQELVSLGVAEDGEAGVVTTLNGKGQDLVRLSAEQGEGVVAVYDPTGRHPRGALFPN